jgi:hypothetical protein
MSLFSAGGAPSLNSITLYLPIDSCTLYVERGITTQLSNPCYTKMTTLPQPASHDLQSKLKELESIPLFMKNLSDDLSNQGDALEALQALIHDGTPDGKCLIQNPYSSDV